VPDKIERDQELDATPEDRLAKLSSAKELNVALSGLAIVAAVAFGLGGVRLHLLAAVVLALLPGVLIYLLHREPLFYAIFKPKRDPRTDLGIAFVICGLGLILGTRDLHFVEVSTLLVYAVLVALLCCAGVFSSARQNPELLRATVAMLFVTGAYGWGLAAAADAVLDKSAPGRYATTVQGMHESHGRSTSYYLDLAPWGPIQRLNDVSVSRTTYEGAFIGEPVCLELRPGVLHVEWYQVVACMEQSGR
jgi:hypothetical protein